MKYEELSATLWLSSAIDVDLTPYFLSSLAFSVSFHFSFPYVMNLSTIKTSKSLSFKLAMKMSTDVNQVGVALFPSS